MKRTLLLVAAALLASCADNRSSIEFTGYCAPAPFDASNGCVTPKDCSIQLEAGWVDLSYPDTASSFFVPVAIANNLVNNADPTANRLNTHDFEVEELDISYSAPGMTIPAATVPMHATIPAASTSVIYAELIPQAVGQFMIGTGALTASFTLVKVSLTAKGKFGDGAVFQTGTSEFPVNVCSGCYAGAPGTTDGGAGTCATNPVSCPAAGQTSAPPVCPGG